MKRNLTHVFVDFARLGLRVADQEAAAALLRRGFILLRSDVVTAARLCVGVKAAAVVPYSEAPQRVTSAGLVRWVFGKLGIELPGRNAELSRILTKLDGKPQIGECPHGGDIFIRGGELIGIATREHTVVYADQHKGEVVERPLSAFRQSSHDHEAWFRILPDHGRWATVILPSVDAVRGEADIIRIILAECAKTPQPGAPPP